MSHSRDHYLYRQSSRNCEVRNLLALLFTVLVISASSPAPCSTDDRRSDSTSAAMSAPNWIYPATISDAVASSAYGPVQFEVDANAAPGVAPWSWFRDVSVGIFPAGMSFSVSGVLAGTPDASAVGTYSFRLAAVDSSGNYTHKQDYSIQVLAPGSSVPTLDVRLGGSAVFHSGSQGLLIFFGTNGAAPYTITHASGVLPSGLFFDGNLEIFGTPSAGTEGSYSVDLNVVDYTGRQALVTQRIIVNPPLPPSTYSNSGGCSISCLATMQSVSFGVWLLVMVIAVFLGRKRSQQLDMS